MSTSPRNQKTNWPKDEFGRSEALGQLWWWVIPIAGLFVIFLSQVWKGSDRRNGSNVIVYCAQDRIYAQPIFTEFEKRSGIKVSALYDNEAVKTVGLANRLLAERSHPQCDLFWGNEEMRTRQLAALDVFRVTNGWTSFGYRSRRVVFNSKHLSVESAPRSLLELTNESWRGKVALAYPHFGTTAAHFYALRQHWGETKWLTWCRGLVANKPFLLDGNSMVVKTVARGDAWVGLTDSDDIADGQREGLPVAACPMNEETLLIPNTLAVTRDAPHGPAAQKLFDYLQNRDVVGQLIAAKALEAYSVKDVSIPTLQPDWALLSRDLDQVTRELDQIFLR